MADLASLTVNLLAETAEYERNLERSQRELGRFQRRQSSTLDLITDGFKGLAAGAAVAAAGLGIIYSRQSEVISEFGRLSATLGIATTDLQAFQMASEQLGIEADVVNDVLEEMNIKIGEAALEGGASADALALLGLSAQQLWDMNPADQFELIAERISGLGTQAEKAAASTILLGDAGFKAIQLFESDAISQARKDIEAFGLALTSVDVAAIQNADKAMARLGAVSDATQKKLAVMFAPFVEAAAIAFIETATSFGGMDELYASVQKNMLEGAVLVANAWQKVTSIWQGVRAVWAKMNVQYERMHGNSESVREAQQQLITEIERLDELGTADWGADVEARITEIQKRAEGAADAVERMHAAANDATYGGVEGEGEASKSNAEFERVRQRLIDEEQAIQESYEARRDIILAETTITEEERWALLNELDGQRNEEVNALQQERNEAELESKAAHDAAMLALENNKWAQIEAVVGKSLGNQLKLVTRFAQLENKTKKASKDFAISMIAATAEGFQQQTGVMFEIGKAAAIANAIINTAQGVTAALSLGLPGIPLAAVIAAAGAAQIATIASTSPSSGGGSISSPSGGSGGGAGTAPPVEDLPDVEPERTAQNVNIVIEPGIYDSNSVRDLIGAINEELSDGIDLNVRVG